ncbi:MAG: hypothetical protein AAGJ89_07780 [Pseudomonadota bacterium]
MFGNIGFSSGSARRHIEAKNLTSKSKTLNKLRYRLFAIVAMSSALPAQATTFNVNLTGKVSEFVTSSSGFAEAAPFAIGDAFSISAVFDATPSGAQFSATTRYANTLISLSGVIGSYTFEKDTTTSAQNDSRVRGMDYISFTGDLFQSIHDVSGAIIGKWSPDTFSYVVFNSTGELLEDDSYGPNLYDPDLLSGLSNVFDGSGDFDSAAMNLFFQSSEPGVGGARVVADLLVHPPTTISPVPLPAGGWLLLGAVGLLLRRGARI